jgi:hypothetical protein
MMKRVFLLVAILMSVQSLLAQYQNIRISKITSTTPEEVTITINPVHQNNLAAGANLNFSYYSLDSGYTWIEQKLTSSDFGVWGDPCVVFDAQGNLHFGHLSNPPLSGYWIDRIVVQRSTDGGATWNNGVGVGYNPPDKNQDKEWIAVDITNSPYQNNIYMAWTEFDRYGSSEPADSTRILFSRSTDAGLTWVSPVRLSDQGGNCIDSDSTVEGAVPAVGPNGEVYVSWSGPLGIVFDKSTDGGVTFGQDIFVTDHPGGWDFNIPGIFRCNGMPVTACDAGNSPFRGNIYINWSDQRYGENNTDIFLIKSTDGGNTWGSVKQVNDDLSGRHQFFTWMTVDQLTGYIYIIFYDRRNTSGDTTDVFVARSVDGGDTFTNFKVNTESFVPRSNIFFGDYTNIAALNGRVYPMWMRMDGGSLSVWTAIIDERLTREMYVNEGWNLMSVPMYLEDYANEMVFPSKVSDAYRYDGTYQGVESTGRNFGFWMKFDETQTVDITGVDVFFDSIRLNAGWNIIGSISTPVQVTTIESDPPGMVLSEFFTYRDSSYSSVDTLYPWNGYWVKSDRVGKLVIGENTVASSANRIIILSDGELPPPPPIDAEQTIPHRFVLYQNYPNPFNPTTKMSFVISSPAGSLAGDLPARHPSGGSFVTLKIYDLLGREVATLVNKVLHSGIHFAEWDAGKYPSGVYYYRLSAGSFTDVKKMVLIR